MLWIALALVLGTLLAPASAWAQEDMPACARAPAPLAEFSGWPAKADLESATKAADLGAAELKPGQAVTAHLHPTREVAYVTQPEKPGGSVAKGGLLSFRIDRAGTYRIGLGAGAWIDVVKDGKTLESTAHGPGPACSGIRKVVDFPLQPGLYILQISASPSDQIGVILTPRP
jgi:hypothetical protein